MAERVHKENEGREPIRVHHFAAGRDLAVEMLREAAQLNLTGEAMLLASDRPPGIHQHRFVVKYLERVQADPGLMDGFAAVLADFLAGPALDVEQYAAVPVRHVLPPANQGSE